MGDSIIIISNANVVFVAFKRKRLNGKKVKNEGKSRVFFIFVPPINILYLFTAASKLGQVVQLLYSQKLSDLSGNA